VSPITETLTLVASVPVDQALQWGLKALALQALAGNELLIRMVSTGVCHTDVTTSLFPVELGGIYPKVIGHKGEFIPVLALWRTKASYSRAL
jgi:Zn-dependent alcohol dehydrogenase